MEFRNRQYSLDERRMRRKSVQTYAYLLTHETEIPLVKRGFLFFYAQEIVRSTLTFIYPIRQLCKVGKENGHVYRYDRRNRHD